MLKSVVSSLVVVSLALTGCGKKKEEGGGDKAKPTEAAKPADPAAKPAEPAAKPAEPAAAAVANLAAVPKDTGVAACDALNPQIDKFNACAKKTEEAKVIVEMTLNAVPQVADMYKNEKEPNQKDINKTALGAACKASAEALTKALTETGC